ncbi:21601_t:CDS:2 [Dentiscutata erythropus]|uniref:21601_t:CDS:1 n=1 Tax=Dentiscutata erythropus TaxID=1348616 RepID=A0A9N9ELR1_9GLOM|nr:21601_t:CDS:2 [Dentiscutata erythropus]
MATEEFITKTNSNTPQSEENKDTDKTLNMKANNETCLNETTDINKQAETNHMSPHDKALTTLDTEQNKFTGTNTRIKQWSEIFPKLKEGKATFVNSGPRHKLYSKNENALIFDIQALENITINKIILAIYTKFGSEILAVKFHLSREKRTQLEIAFKNKEAQQKYAATYLNKH